MKFWTGKTTSEKLQANSVYWRYHIGNGNVWKYAQLVNPYITDRAGVPNRHCCSGVKWRGHQYPQFWVSIYCYVTSHRTNLETEITFLKKRPVFYLHLRLIDINVWNTKSPSAAEAWAFYDNVVNIRFADILASFIARPLQIMVLHPLQDWLVHLPPGTLFTDMI